MTNETVYTDPDERYLADERRGILIGNRPTTPLVEALVKRQIEEYRKQRNKKSNDNQMPRL